MNGREVERSVAAASQLFERLLEEVARQEGAPRLQLDGALQALGDADTRAPLVQIRSALARAIDLYADLMRETFDAYVDALELALARGGAMLTGAPGPQPVALNGAPGERAATTVWLHNGTPSPLTAVRLRLTDLAAHDGAVLAGRAATFAPDEIDVAPGASGSTTLALAVPSRAAAGAYHGLVLAAGLPTTSVPVVLTVE